MKSEYKRTNYPSDLTDKQWEKIEHFFPSEKALFYYPSVRGVCADNAYRKHFKQIFEEFHNIRVDIPEHLTSTFTVMPKRWRVERTFSWFGGYRRLSKDFEYSVLSEENMIYFSYLFTKPVRKLSIIKKLLVML